MGLDLTKTQKSIRGMFWLPGQEDKQFSGVLRLKAGKSARLDTASVNSEDMANWFPNRPIPKKGETITLTGDEFYKAMWGPSPKIIHGHDEQGAAITLIPLASSIRTPRINPTTPCQKSKDFKSETIEAYGMFS